MLIDSLDRKILAVLQTNARASLQEVGQAVGLSASLLISTQKGGADKNLDWFYAASPRLTRYSMGLREPREILIRFSLYQRM